MANGLVTANVPEAFQRGQANALALAAQRQQLEKAQQQGQQQAQQQALARQALGVPGLQQQQQVPLTAEQARAELFVRNPALGEQIFDRLGAVSQQQRDEAALFAFQASGLDEERQNVFLDQRIAEIDARGGSSIQSRKLRSLPFNERQDDLKALQMAALSPQQRLDIQQGRKQLPFQKGGAFQVNTPQGAGIATPVFNPATGVVETRISPLGKGVVPTSRIGETAADTEARRFREAQAQADVNVSEVLTKEAVSKEVRQQLQLNKIKIDETKIKNEQEKTVAINAKNARRKEATNAAALVTGLLAGDRFSSAFGRVVNNLPESVRPQESIDARAEVDQVVGLLSLESRQKLKGQGTITDSEAKTLEKSATVLANPLISDTLAKRELGRVRGIFESAAARNQLDKTTLIQRAEGSNAPAGGTAQIGRFQVREK